jgi:hypothetical protein
MNNDDPNFLLGDILCIPNRGLHNDQLNGLVYGKADRHYQIRWTKPDGSLYSDGDFSFRHCNDYFKVKIPISGWTIEDCF